MVKKIQNAARKPDQNGKPVFKKNQASALGDIVKAVILGEDQEAFYTWAVKRPRVMELISKSELNQEDKDALSAAYKAFKEEEKRSTAIVKQEAASLAPLLGVSEKETAGYLEVYKPEQLQDLVVIAQREGAEAKDVVEIDLTLLLDGSYIEREKETVTVSSVHARLGKVAEQEFDLHASRKAIQKQDVKLDELWDRLLKEHNGDEIKAAEEYAQIATERLTETKTRAKTKKVEVSTEMVVEIFKLFNYDRDDVSEFMDFVETKFRVGPGDSVNSLERIVDDLLQQFVEENAGRIILNDRSKFYSKARRTQIEVLGLVAGAQVQQLGGEQEEEENIEEDSDEPSVGTGEGDLQGEEFADDESHSMHTIEEPEEDTDDE